MWVWDKVNAVDIFVKTTYFMTYFYAPISTIVSGVLQPPIISLQSSMTIIIRPTL